MTINLNGFVLDRGLHRQTNEVNKMGTSTGHVIEVQKNATLTLMGGTLTGGYADYGGAIYNRGTVTIEGTDITGNEGYYNGGAICNRGVMTITGGTISGNKSPDGGDTLDGRKLQGKPTQKGIYIRNDKKIVIK